MRIEYLANVRMPTERAHGIQIMNTCAALARAGAEVELVLPTRRATDAADPFDYYGVERNFAIRRLPSVDLLGSLLPQKASYWLQEATFFVSVAFAYARRFGDRETVFYGRDDAVLALVSLFSPRVFWEAHLGNRNAFARLLARRAAGVVSITKGLAELYLSLGAEPNRTLVSPDAVDVARFSRPSTDRLALRSALGVPKDAIVAAYSGSLGAYSWKGVDVFLASAGLAKSPSLRFLVVGGSKGEAEALKAANPDPRIVFAGRVSPEAVPSYLALADVLVLPNKSGNEVSERFTSPMKLFEYMAAGRPIVASDLPSIREVLTDESALFVAPNDPAALARGIERLASDPGLASELARKASEDVRAYTWDKRAAGLLGFISSRI